ncbi:MAG: hypothetical protein ACE5GM_01945 [bacterium]
MADFQFWRRILLLVSVFTILSGILMAFFNETALFRIFDDQVNTVFFAHEVIPESVREYHRWNYGVIGAAMGSWGVFFWFLVYYPFAKKERWAWNCMTAAILFWFCIDAPVSFYYRVTVNGLFDIFMFVSMMVPLLAIKKHFA